MDEPLFNELLESVKQADQIMSDHAELRRLAERADALYGMPSLEHEYAISKFRVASTPKTILAMLDEIDGLRSRLEIDERTPHDGIACRDETIKVLDEKCDRLKAENEVLRGALQAVVDDPTWRSNDNTLWPKIIKAMDKGPSHDRYQQAEGTGAAGYWLRYEK